MSDLTTGRFSDALTDLQQPLPAVETGRPVANRETPRETTEAANALVAVDASRMGPRWKWWRKGWLRRRGLREVCWFCHADYAGMPCPTCGWSRLRHVVFVDQDGKRYTNEVMAGDRDPWRAALITSPGMGRGLALPLEVQP